MLAAWLAIPGVIIALLAWIGYRAKPGARLFCVAIMLGMGYWYLLPGTLFLAGGEVSASDLDLLADERHIIMAIGLVHGCLVLLFLLPALFSGTWRHRQQTSTDVDPKRPSRRLDWLLLATVISATVFLANRYAEMGPAFALQLLIGLTSAREVMTFENFSAGTAQSLLALWDIVNIFLAIFLATTLTWRRELLTGRFVAAATAALLSFVSSGSRTVVLLLLFAVTIALICRPRQVIQSPLIQSIRVSSRNIVPLLLMAGLVVMAAMTMLARFQDNPSQSESLALNSIGAHNDMFRELVFVLRNGWAYRADPLLFLQTPITYAMPTFLGFNKSIPPQLIDFNLDRAGIDLILGEGNVFPGLVADMILAFGYFAPVALCLYSAVIFATLVFSTTRGTDSTINFCLLITLLCYYIISFRNIQGAFAILMVLAMMVSVILSQRSRRRPTEKLAPMPEFKND